MTVPSSEDKPHSHGKYLAVITLLALLVVALGGVAGYYYANRTTVQGTKPAPPTLTTRLFSQPVSLVTWNRNNVTIPAASICFSGIGGLVSYGGLNFTENLSGRDPGSTLIQFNSGIVLYVLYLFRSQDITLSVIDQLACSNTPALTISQFTVGGGIAIGTSVWRVPASGNYTLFAECQSPFCKSFAISGPFTAKESWTVTTIS